MSENRKGGSERRKASRSANKPGGRKGKLDRSVNKPGRTIKWRGALFMRMSVEFNFVGTFA
jgi:hypothetical protein